MTIGQIGNHPAPTPNEPREYSLFYISVDIITDVAEFFSDLQESNDYFLLVPAMRITHLAWRPDRVKRSDVRALTDQHQGAWVALTSPTKSTQLRRILARHIDN